MELSLKIETVIKTDTEGFICCSGKDYALVLRHHQQKEGLKILQNILDGMGNLSAKAQTLKQVITNSIRFMGTDHRIYIKVKDNKALGFLKVGEKNLFYRDYIGNIKQLKPTCVLDFYVHESCQRSGIGKQIFEKFLKQEGKIPEKLAYDRPSQKLISFLRKHYGLSKFIPQNNNYVVFDRYFDKGKLDQQKPVRPRSMVPMEKVEEPLHKIALEKRQSLDMNATFQGKTLKHKNTSSEGFPFGIPVSENLAFRTTSNAYGNHYRRK